MIEQYVMREPCRWCLKEEIRVIIGRLETVNGQDVVRCSRCERQCYNAPRSETGKPQRKIKTREDLSYGQRERILQRDCGRCLLCGRDPLRHGVILNVAHVLSVADGHKQGLSDEVLNDDGNLVTACEECNSGLGRLSFNPQIWIALLWAQIGRRG